MSLHRRDRWTHAQEDSLPGQRKAVKWTSGAGSFSLLLLLCESCLSCANRWFLFFVCATFFRKLLSNLALTASSKSMYSKGRVVTGHASSGITNNHGEQRTIVRRCCWWSRIWRLSRSGNVHAVLHPLILQWRCACRRHAEFGCLSHIDCLISWLCGDCRRYPYR